MRLLSQRLGHGKVRGIVDRIAAAIEAGKASRGDARPATPNSFRDLLRQPRQVDIATATAYTNAYFGQVHPLFPFLDREEFERQALGEDVMARLGRDHGFSALYHAVLALGCQHCGDRSFDPVTSEAWGFYQVALGLLPDVLLIRGSLVNLQVNIP